MQELIARKTLGENRTTDQATSTQDLTTPKKAEITSYTAILRSQMHQSPEQIACLLQNWPKHPAYTVSYHTVISELAGVINTSNKNVTDNSWPNLIALLEHIDTPVTDPQHSVNLGQLLLDECAKKESDLKRVTLLLQKGASLFFARRIEGLSAKKEITAIKAAAINHHWTLIKEILLKIKPKGDQEADAEKVSDSLGHALHRVTQQLYQQEEKGSLDEQLKQQLITLIKELLQAGANTVWRTTSGVEEGYFALHYMILFCKKYPQHCDVVKALLLTGNAYAEWEKSTAPNQISPLQLAFESGVPQILALLAQFGTKLNPERGGQKALRTLQTNLTNENSETVDTAWLCIQAFIQNTKTSDQLTPQLYEDLLHQAVKQAADISNSVTNAGQQITFLLQQDTIEKFAPTEQQQTQYYTTVLSELATVAEDCEKWNHIKSMLRVISETNIQKLYNLISCPKQSSNEPSPSSAIVQYFVVQTAYTQQSQLSQLSTNIPGHATLVAYRNTASAELAKAFYGSFSSVVKWKALSTWLETEANEAANEEARQALGICLRKECHNNNPDLDRAALLVTKGADSSIAVPGYRRTAIQSAIYNRNWALLYIMVAHRKTNEEKTADLDEALLAATTQLAETDKNVSEAKTLTQLITALLAIDPQTKCYMTNNGYSALRSFISCCQDTDEHYNVITQFLRHGAHQAQASNTQSKESSLLSAAFKRGLPQILLVLAQHNATLDQDALNTLKTAIQSSNSTQADQAWQCIQAFVQHTPKKQSTGQIYDALLMESDQVKTALPSVTLNYELYQFLLSQALKQPAAHNIEGINNIIFLLQEDTTQKFDITAQQYAQSIAQVLQTLIENNEWTPQAIQTVLKTIPKKELMGIYNTINGSKDNQKISLPQSILGYFTTQAILPRRPSDNEPSDNDKKDTLIQWRNRVSLQLAQALDSTHSLSETQQRKTWNVFTAWLVTEMNEKTTPAVQKALGQRLLDECANKNPDLQRVTLLLQKGADLSIARCCIKDLRNKGEITAIEAAALNGGRWTLVEKILSEIEKKDSQTNHSNSLGHTLYIAAQQLYRIVQATAGLSSEQQAAQKQQLTQLIPRLLEAGAILTWRDTGDARKENEDYGYFALHYIIVFCKTYPEHCNLVESLLHADAYRTWTETKETAYPTSPLKLAFESGAPQILKWLAQKGAKLNRQENQAQETLKEALTSNNSQTMDTAWRRIQAFMEHAETSDQLDCEFYDYLLCQAVKQAAEPSEDYRIERIERITFLLQQDQVNKFLTTEQQTHCYDIVFSQLTAAAENYKQWGHIKNILNTIPAEQIQKLHQSTSLQQSSSHSTSIAIAKYFVAQAARTVDDNDAALTESQNAMISSQLAQACHCNNPNPAAWETLIAWLKTEGSTETSEEQPPQTVQTALGEGLLDECTSDPDLQRVELLVQYGADLSAQRQGRTAIETAISKKQWALLQAIVSQRKPNENNQCYFNNALSTATDRLYTLLRTPEPSHSDHEEKEKEKEKEKEQELDVLMSLVNALLSVDPSTQCYQTSEARSVPYPLLFVAIEEVQPMTIS